MLVDILKAADDWPHRERALLALRNVPPGYTSLVFRVDPTLAPHELHACWLACYDCGLRWREWRVAGTDYGHSKIGPCPRCTELPRFATKQASLARLSPIMREATRRAW